MSIHRAQTKAMVFKSDWPGIFIRGDDAWQYKTCINDLLELYQKHAPEEYDYDPESVVLLAKQIADLLVSCSCSPNNPKYDKKMQKLKDIDDCIKTKD